LEEKTPLLVALTKSDPETLAELLRFGADPFALEKSGRNLVELLVEEYKPERYTILQRQAWREVLTLLKKDHRAEEAVNQLERRDMELEKELLHPRKTKFLKSTVWNLGKSKNK
jgi:hypothetical protein